MIDSLVCMCAMCVSLRSHSMNRKVYMILIVTFLFRGKIFCCGLYVYYTMGEAKPRAAQWILNKNYD